MSACSGGIIRDCQGKIHYTFSTNFGSCLVFRVEMKAVKIGIDFTKRIKKLMIQMDNHSSIEALLSIELYEGECIHIVHQCKELIKNHNCEVAFLHY